MSNLRIEQFEVDKYRVVGSVSIMETECKYVTVDGIEYTNERRVPREKCASTLNVYNVELDDLECFGFKPTILEHDFLYNKMFKSQAETECRYSLSTNEYVAYWQWLGYTKRLPFYVKSVFTSDSYGSNVTRQKLSPYCTIKLFDYGFNNSLYAEVSWRMILTRKDKKQIPNHHLIAQLLDRYKIDLYNLNDKNIVLTSINILNKITA